MGGDPIDFATDADFQFADSYFNKFKDLFYAAERDADEALDGGHYQQMRDIVAAILRRRVPSLTMGNRRRFGSRLRRIIGRLGNPQLQARLTRAYHRADDAEILAMVIMAQNESTNIMFYHDKDPFQKKEGLLTRLSKLVGRVEVGRLAVRQTISKPLNTVLRLSEGATGLTLKAGNKIVSNTGRLLTRAPGGILEKINKAIE